MKKLEIPFSPPDITEEEINNKLKEWEKKKTEKLKKIFLEKGEKDNG